MAQQQIQVRADYDFDAQPGSGELTVRTGDVLTVIRRGIEGGWMEGQNAKGKIGLFPESYVSVVPLPTPATSTRPPPPTAALPSLPTGAGQSYAAPPTTLPTKSTVPSKRLVDDPWDDPSSVAIAPSYIPPSLKGGTPSSAPTLASGNAGLIGMNAGVSAASASTSTGNVSYPQLNNNDGGNHFDDFDDDWSDDDEEMSEFSLSDVQRGGSLAHNNRFGAGSDSTSAITAVGRQGSTASKMKTINRFSNFVKTGMESFILASSRLTSQPQESYQIVISPQGHIEWVSNGEEFTCAVHKPKKESKLRGLKHFIAYSLTCSSTGIQVSRRYKHFDWLHDQLSNKFLLIPIPPLPEKQVAGRYEEDLIEHRKSILQLWVNKICRHPVLSQSKVWRHFITCTDDNKWKPGKRMAEKDEYVGGNFFHCISAPKQPQDPAKTERQVENFARSVRSMDESIRELHERVTETQKRMIGPYKSNWQKMAGAFDSLGKSLEMDQCRTAATDSVKDALKMAAHFLHRVGAHHEEHGKKGMEPILDYLFTYKGIYANVPDIVNVHKSALSKMRDLQNLPTADAEAIRERVDVTSYAMLAEISHLNRERDDDFRQMFGGFFAEQAQFYAEIGRQMAELADVFQKAQPN